jgi:hypothetical protein
VAALESFRASGAQRSGVDVDARLALARQQLSRVTGAGYLKELEGTIGADPFHGQTLLG